jgi:FdhD protein
MHVLSEPMHAPVEVVRWNGMDFHQNTDSIVVEEPMEIRVNDLSLAVTMRTPGSDEALAAGFLVTEGIIHTREEIYDITRCADPSTPELRNIVTVYLPPELLPFDRPTGRQRYANSSCGLCGKATLEEVRRMALPIEQAPRLSREVILSLPKQMRQAQQIFERTGGLHACGLFDANGNLYFVEEDVGRHNAVDKLVGRALLEGPWPLNGMVMMVSGRAGFEIVQKALVARIGTVCSVSAPSSLAVALAREANMVLVGFVRGETMNVYAGAQNIVNGSFVSNEPLV